MACGACALLFDADHNAAIPRVFYDTTMLNKSLHNKLNCYIEFAIRGQM